MDSVTIYQNSLRIAISPLSFAQKACLRLCKSMIPLSRQGKW